MVIKRYKYLALIPSWSNKQYKHMMSDSKQDSITNSVKAQKLNGLDTLRAFAIVLVFMYHYQVFVSREATFGLASTIGWIGVDLFFVLSGYLIANQIFSGIVRGQALSLKAFYARRFLRTLPNFYVVLALYFLFPAVMGGNTPPALWRFLSFTQNYQLPPGTAFSHAWSLCIEEQFYLVLPAVVMLCVRYGKSISLGWVLLIGLIVMGIATRGTLWLHYGRLADGAINGYHPHIYYSTFCRFDELLPGVAIAMLKNFHPDTWKRLMLKGNALLIAGVLSCTVLVYLLLNYYDIEGYGYGFFMTAFGYSLIAMCFAVLTVAALSPSSWLYRVRVPGAAQLAAWSYAIYLSHKALAVIIERLLANHGIDARSGLAVLLISCVCVAGGWLLYRLVETPFMKLRDARFPTNFPTNLPTNFSTAAHQK
jgi:peptidoglycan/LPS O-acetylase OafA/YrhL